MPYRRPIGRVRTAHSNIAQNRATSGFRDGPGWHVYVNTLGYGRRMVLSNASSAADLAEPSILSTRRRQSSSLRHCPQYDDRYSTGVRKVSLISQRPKAAIADRPGFRASCFMRIHGASMVGNLLSPALASIMMASTGPWPTIFVSFLLTGLPGPLIFLVPETLKRRDVDDNDEPDRGTFKRHLKQSLLELKKSARVFRSPSMLIILLITMLQATLVFCTLQFLGQFTSKRYNIPLADTGFIQSAYGISFIVVSFLILPYVTSALLKSSAPAFLRFNDDRQRDLFLARSSYVASMIATFILGLSGSLAGFVFGLVILAFGVSGEGFLKSIATLYVTAEQRSRLFTILALAAMSSNLWASPALAALFSLGMRLGGVWIGLPYFGIFGLCIVMFASSFFIKLPPFPGVDEESDPDQNHARNEGTINI